MPNRRDAIRSLAAAGAMVASRDLRGRVAAAQGPAELLIRGGRVVNADGVREADVRIVGETIAEVEARLRPGGARVIEARNHLVMPGGIDPHTHLHPSFVDDLTSGSMAAVAGGITTVGTFANTEKGEEPLAAMKRMAARVRAEAIADVLLHLSSWPPSPELASALPALADFGQPSVKVFLTRADFGAHLAQFIAQLEAAKRAGVVTLAHCEDGAMLAAAVRRLTAAGRTSLDHYAASRPVIAEVAATAQMAALCEDTGAPVYVVHLSSARALEVCRAARARRVPLFVETRPMYLHLTTDKMQGPDAPLYVGQPPLREQADRDAIWRGLAEGAVDVLATDHAPWTREQKLDPSLSIARVRPGVSDLQFMLPMYFSEGVVKRKLPLTRFVETTSTTPARIFGLYPKKGVIRAGADADVVLWDPERRGVVSAETDLSKSDYSVYEGWTVTGWPVMTIRRGEVIGENGRVTGQAGSGRLIGREPWRG